jgi:hypothetical protein
MNNYELTTCPNCKEVVITSWHGTVKVAGLENLNLATRMLKIKSIKEVAEQFCRDCLCSKSTHMSESEYNKKKQSDWLPWHKFDPQDNTFV